MSENFYGEPVDKFRAMAQSTGGCDEAHFRMWCSIAADTMERLFLLTAENRDALNASLQYMTPENTSGVYARKQVERQIKSCEAALKDYTK